MAPYFFYVIKTLAKDIVTRINEKNKVGPSVCFTYTRTHASLVAKV